MDLFLLHAMRDTPTSKIFSLDVSPGLPDLHHKTSSMANQELSQQPQTKKYTRVARFASQN